MKTINYAVMAAALAIGTAASVPPAAAQVSISGYVLPMDLAMEAALASVRACEAKGYAITATVVDVAGTPQVLLRGDHATIHTRDSAYRKAYTVVTMGPIFHFGVTSQFSETLAKYPPLAAESLISTPNVTALSGGAAIMVRGEIVAGLGVGGSPGGDKDEACAIAGVAKIQSRLPN